MFAEKIHSQVRKDHFSPLFRGTRGEIADFLTLKNSLLERTNV
jgi:hypothetical protein